MLMYCLYIPFIAHNRLTIWGHLKIGQSYPSFLLAQAPSEVAAAHHLGHLKIGQSYPSFLLAQASSAVAAAVVALFVGGWYVAGGSGQV